MGNTNHPLSAWYKQSGFYPYDWFKFKLMEYDQWSLSQMNEEDTARYVRLITNYRSRWDNPDSLKDPSPYIYPGEFKQKEQPPGF